MPARLYHSGGRCTLLLSIHYSAKYKTVKLSSDKDNYNGKPLHYNAETLHYNAKHFPYNARTFHYNAKSFPYNANTFHYNAKHFPYNARTFHYNANSLHYNEKTFPYSAGIFFIKEGKARNKEKCPKIFNKEQKVQGSDTRLNVSVVFVQYGRASKAS